MISLSAFSQKAPQIEKAFHDPARMENAAKADLYLHKKGSVSDSVQTITAIKAVTSKKRSCRQKPSK